MFLVLVDDVKVDDRFGVQQRPLKQSSRCLFSKRLDQNDLQPSCGMSSYLASKSLFRRMSS